MTDMVRQVLRMLHSMALVMTCHLVVELLSALVDSHLTFHDKLIETTRIELH